MATEEQIKANQQNSARVPEVRQGSKHPRKMQTNMGSPDPCSRGVHRVLTSLSRFFFQTVASVFLQSRKT